MPADPNPEPSCDRNSVIRPIPKNIVFVTACNPFKMKQISSENEDDVINVHPNMRNLLSHRVFPIPPRMLYDLWDYGSLDSSTEEKYIEAMVQQLKLKKDYLDCFVQSVKQGQHYIKTKVERQQSSASLRDIKRVIRIFRFYYNYLLFRERFTPENHTEDSHPSFEDFCERRRDASCEAIAEDHFVRSFILTILINYVFRIARQSNEAFLLTVRAEE